MADLAESSLDERARNIQEEKLRLFCPLLTLFHRNDEKNGTHYPPTR
jgi:hypothetical protein